MNYKSDGKGAGVTMDPFSGSLPCTKESSFLIVPNILTKQHYVQNMTHDRSQRSAHTHVYQHCSHQESYEAKLGKQPKRTGPRKGGTH